MRNRKDPRRAQFMDNIRMAYADGGRVEDITGLSDAGVLPDTVSSEEGVDMGSGNRFLDILGDTAVELTGIPSIVRGGRNIGRAFSEGDPLRGLQGAGEVALGALPGAAAFRPGRALLRALTATPGRAVGSTAALGATGLPSEIGDAQAEAETNAGNAIFSDPEVKALMDMRTEAQAAYDAMNQKHRRSPPVTQQKALEPYQKRLNDIDAKITEAENRARNAYIKEAPFRERYPGAAEAIGYGAMGLGAAIPFANTVKKRLADTLVNAPSMRRATKAANTAFDAGNDMDFIRQQARLADKVKNWEGAHSTATGIGDFAKNAGLGGLLAFEGAAVPEQVDALAFPPGHPTRQRAREELGRGGYYLERLPAAALTGLLTSKVGSELGKVVTPGGRPELGAAREVLDRGSDKSREALQRLRDYRDVVGEARRAATPLPSTPSPSSPPSVPSQPSGQRAISAPTQSDAPHYERQRRGPDGRWSGGYREED